MTTREDDTVEDPVEAIDVETSSPSLHQAEGGPTAAKSSSSVMNRSEPEPIDVVLRKLVERPRIVPNSVEPGVRYQATHAPARAYRDALEPKTVAGITTDPQTPGAREPRDGERQVETVRRSSSQRSLMFALAVAIAIALLAALGVTLQKGDLPRPPPASAALPTATLSLPPAASALGSLPPATFPVAPPTPTTPPQTERAAPAPSTVSPRVTGGTLRPAKSAHPTVSASPLAPDSAGLPPEPPPSPLIKQTPL
jgi:hypothetical protein